jgi:large exoprotein involved in heme utilization and adhesion
MSDAQFLSTKGNAGNVFVTSYELTIQNGGQISSSTFGSGKAGNVDINAATITLNNAGIHSASVVANSSETGHIHIFASDWLHLENQAFISIENQATHATNTTLHGDITITAPDIDLKNSSITTESNGNVDAGDIYINFTDKLMMDPSYIKTTANTGNGGDIHINGGKLIYLQGSAFLTSVTGANSKGGDIKVTANSLIMNNAVIQANAVGGSGGDINLNLQSLIPSQDQLIKGGAQVIWQPFIEGFNVIQAASENGVNGSINLTFPQFNISGSISGLSSVALVIPKIDRWGCRGVTTSSNTRGNSLLETILKSKLAYTAENALVRGSTGGIPVTEARYSFIPPANNLPNSTKESSENPMLPISSSNSRILSGESYPCAKLSL